jgi:hypothetical protein
LRSKPTAVPPSFFELTRNEQKELLQGAEYRTPWSTKMLEKDVWIVWTLDALFRQPNAPRYAFKGGTCLSKAYGAIHRFSEDIDITLDPDHPTYIEGLDPIEPGVTKNQLKQRGDRARAKLPEYLALTLVPYLEQRAQQLPEHSRPTIVLEDGDEGRVRVHYPSALEPSPAPPYIAENVLLELGARASTEPSQRADVGTYLGNLPQLEGQVAFPAATVNALSLVRTFWEKATLIHFEITRNDRAAPAERYARHWYDLHAGVAPSSWTVWGDRPQPHPRLARLPLRPLVEPSCGGSSDRPRVPHRATPRGERAHLHHHRHPRRADRRDDRSQTRARG